MVYKGINIGEKLSTIVKTRIETYPNQTYKSYSPDELRHLAYMADITTGYQNGIEFGYEDDASNGLPGFVVSIVTEVPETEEEKLERMATAMDDIDKAWEEESQQEEDCGCGCESDDKTVQELASEYKELASKYATEFCLRYFDTDSFFWIGTEHNPAIGVCDMVVDYETVRYAVDNEIEGCVLFEWYDTSARIAAISERLETPTLHEWVDGYRGPSAEQLYRLEGAKKSLEDACANFDRMLKETVR